MKFLVELLIIGSFCFCLSWFVLAMGHEASHERIGEIYGCEVTRTTFFSVNSNCEDKDRSVALAHSVAQSNVESRYDVVLGFSLISVWLGLLSFYQLKQYRRKQ
jgi:hypothetical protein